MGFIGLMFTIVCLYLTVSWMIKRETKRFNKHYR